MGGEASCEGHCQAGNPNVGGEGQKKVQIICKALLLIWAETRVELIYLRGVKASGNTTYRKNNMSIINTLCILECPISQRYLIAMGYVIEVMSMNLKVFPLTRRSPIPRSD